ncbi:hypothetical protein [Emticicia fluvialis]|uniref:hypothetical protein n=2 Tax=Emticicia TaxID=312278 RepID=UPI0021662E83|nr:hypothetical protein [Emticicia fluvialis]
MENILRLFHFTIELLKLRGIKHEFTSFDSGAIMLDIWHNEKFYVIQFDVDGYIGVSEVNNDNMGFDTIPDEKFYDEIKYKNKLESMLMSENR